MRSATICSGVMSAVRVASPERSARSTSSPSTVWSATRASSAFRWPLVAEIASSRDSFSRRPLECLASAAGAACASNALSSTGTLWMVTGGAERRQATIEDLALGAQDRQLPALARIGLTLQELRGLFRIGPGQGHGQAQLGQIGPRHLERPRGIPEQVVVEADRAQQAPHSHGGAGRQVA